MLGNLPTFRNLTIAYIIYQPQASRHDVASPPTLRSGPFSAQVLPFD